MCRVLLCLMLLGAISAVDAPGARAQTAPSVDKKRIAKQYVDAGLAAQSAGDYDTAITFYAKAYDVVPHPTLIFNMAQAHRLAGRIEQALTLYKRYLSEDPAGPQAKTARELVAEIEARKAEAARKAEIASRVEPEPRRVAPPQLVALGNSGEAFPAAAAALPRDTAPQTTQEPAQPGRTQRIAGIAMGAGGVAVLAVGIGFGLHARSLADELSRDGAVYSPAKMRDGERANAIAIAGIAGGAALVAAGAALTWWGYAQRDSAERVSLAPMLSPHIAGLVLSGALP